jgi:DNA-binding response OmpR family regulator
VLLDQIIINKDFDVIQSNSLEDVKSHVEQSPVDLLIMGEDVGPHSLSLLLKFIKEINFTNKILFIKDGDSGEISSFEGFTNNHHVIEKPFRIQFFIKKIDFVLAKISGSSDVSYRIGPFVFFPENKVIKFNDQPDIELTEKEVSILKCLLSHSEESVDREKLLKQVWNYNLGVTTHTLESHIYRLRQKLETDPSIPRLIISEGGGFKINQI